MPSKRLSLLVVCAFCLIATAAAVADIGVRGGAMYPRGDFKDFAKAGLRAEITADINMFSVPFLSTVVAFGAADFGKKETVWQQADQFYTQESKTALTGGGVGLRLEPPSMIIRPFGEALIRLASIEQDYESGIGGSELKSRTKLGYQLNAGLKFTVAPKVGLEAGATWMTFPNCKFTDKLQEVEIDLHTFGIFAGLTLGIGI